MQGGGAECMVMALSRLTYIVHHAGKKNLCADYLSRQPVMPATSDEDVNTEVQIAQISCKISSMVSAML